MARVVRAGEAKAVDLAKGYQEHLGAPGLYGFPVQYQAGVPWQELARAGQYPNAQVSIAEEEDLRAALQSLGYDLRLISDNVEMFFLLHHRKSLSRPGYKCPERRQFQHSRHRDEERLA